MQNWLAKSFLRTPSPLRLRTARHYLMTAWREAAYVLASLTGFVLASLQGKTGWPTDALAAKLGRSGCAAIVYPFRERALFSANVSKLRARGVVKRHISGVCHDYQTAARSTALYLGCEVIEWLKTSGHIEV